MRTRSLRSELRILRFGSIIVIAAMSLLVGGGRADAQTYGPQPLGVSCTISVTTAGIGLTCSTSGFRPGASVNFTIYSTPTGLGSATADANGRAVLNVTLPSTLEAGDHRLEAVGEAATGGRVTVSTLVSIPSLTEVLGAAVGTGQALPRTGYDAALLASAGSALVAVGGMLVFTTRRRRRQAQALAG